MATAKILVIGGAGGGGGASASNGGGGGGAGGFLYEAAHTVVSGSYSITVGGGGAGNTGDSQGVSGSNSVFSDGASTMTAIGGGAGGGHSAVDGLVGGSGGGAASFSGLAGQGTDGPPQQGYDGGAGTGSPFASSGAGAGGSAGIGADAILAPAGDAAGGIGTSNSITGTPVTYAAGGAGGSNSSALPGDAGAANTGNGGGGGRASSGDGGAGGSGVVIIAYTTTQFTHTGGDATGTDGLLTWVKFTASGTFVLTALKPTVTTQAVSAVAATTATGNGNITSVGVASCDERGIVYSTTTHGDPGNVAPGSSSYSGLVNETGTFGTGAFTRSLTGLVSRTTYYARAYAHNSAGYSYGAEVSFTTLGFTNPGNVYASDNAYATLAAVDGILSVEISKDGGVNYGTPLTKTFGGSDTLETYGAGSTELWGASYTRADMVDANLRIRLSQGNISQVYKTFGFVTGTELLTGVEVAIEAKYSGGVLSIDLLKVKIYYGTSILPVQAGSQVYASNGRKNGEGAGLGTGVMVFYDLTAWRACDTGVAVAA